MERQNKQSPVLPTTSPGGSQGRREVTGTGRFGVSDAPCTNGGRSSGKELCREVNREGKWGAGNGFPSSSLLTWVAELPSPLGAPERLWALAQCGCS